MHYFRFNRKKKKTLKSVGKRTEQGMIISEGEPSVSLTYYVNLSRPLNAYNLSFFIFKRRYWSRCVKMPCSYKTLELQAKSKQLSRALEIGPILYKRQDINMNQVNKKTKVSTARTTELLQRPNTLRLQYCHPDSLHSQSGPGSPESISSKAN